MSELRSQDGTRLVMHHWPARPPQAARLLIVHGYFEHGARYNEFAEAMTARGITVSAVDLRGHGSSDGARGHITAFEQYLDDVDAAFAALGPAEDKDKDKDQSSGTKL